MPVLTGDLLEVLAEICDEKDLKVNISQSLKGGVLTGITAMVGGILLGPVGLAIGGILGGSTAAVCSKNSFKPVSVIIKNMKEDQKRKLINKIKEVFKNFGIEDVKALVKLILTTPSFQDLAIREVSNFISQEIKLKTI